LKGDSKHVVLHFEQWKFELDFCRWRSTSLM